MKSVIARARASWIGKKTGFSSRVAVAAQPRYLTAKRKMILTNCAACAAPWASVVDGLGERLAQAPAPGKD